MIIRPMPTTLLSFLLFVALGCGGASKSAETSGSGSKDSSSSGPGNSDSSSSDSDAPGDSPSGGDAKADASGGPTGDKTKISSGLQMLDSRSMTLDFDLNLIKKGQGMGVQSGNWAFSEERTLRVKTAKKDVITELQVVYGKWTAKPLLGITYETPTDGKTYMLVNSGSGLTITRGANEHVSGGDEQRIIEAEFGWVGERSSLRQVLLASKLEPGSNLGKSAELAQQILGEIPGADSSQNELSATLDKVEGGSRKKALLKIEAKARIISNKTSFALELNGTAAVDVATGWVVAADLAGTTQATGSIKHPKQGELEVTGKGKVTLTRKGEFK